LKSPVVKSASARPKSQEALVEMGARAEDLGDLAFDQLARTRLLQLFANSDLAPRLEQAGDVTMSGVEGDAAHGDVAAFGQGDVEQRRASFGVLEKHLVEIAQPEEQKGFARQLAFDAAILRHHRR
jgi:hypothetical protein